MLVDCENPEGKGQKSAGRLEEGPRTNHECAQRLHKRRVSAALSFAVGLAAILLRRRSRQSTAAVSEASRSRSVAAYSVLGLLAFALAVVGFGEHQAVGSADSPYNLLANPGLEQYDSPFDQWHGADCQVALGWQRFWYGGPEPAWMDGRVYGEAFSDGWVEHIEGETAQFVVGTEAYSAGLFQRVDGLVPGRGYGFHTAFITIFQSSAQPPVHGAMVKQVGIDPSGGSDPQASTVLWSEPNSRDKEWDLQQRMSILAQASSLTVFLRVESPYEAGDWPFVNLSILDSAILAETPTVTARSATASAEPSFTVEWDSVQLAPGADQFKGCDVQWLDEAEGVWHNWYTQTLEVAALFDGEVGHTYRFRARAWQSYTNGAWLYGPYRSEGDSRTTVSSARLTGQVLSPKDRPVSGALVVVSGTTETATSGSDGRYILGLEAEPEPTTISVTHPYWASPAPVYGIQFVPGETVALDWTLRPPGDAVKNGGFEDGVAGWTIRSESGVTPQPVSEPVHTGRVALSLGGSAPASHTTGLSQTLVLTRSWEPVVSFWYQPAASQAADALNVKLTVMGSAGAASTVASTTVFTPALDVRDWHHVWYAVGPSRTLLTATVTLEFLVRDTGGEATIVYLDEVSLGASAGGPYWIYLPLAANRRR